LCWEELYSAFDDEAFFGSTAVPQEVNYTVTAYYDEEFYSGHQNVRV
jgi:hypothetical protein